MSGERVVKWGSKSSWVRAFGGVIVDAPRGWHVVNPRIRPAAASVPK